MSSTGSPKQRTTALASVRRHMRGSIVAVAVLVGGVAAWASTTDFADAIMAQGFVVVDSNVKKVQHPTGGVVGEILVKDGDQVAAGDVVVRLDDTITRANLGIVVKILDELRARQARLEAERDGSAALTFSPELLARRDNPEAARAIASESRLFELRRSARAGQTAQLRERIAQLHEEIEGYDAQIAAKHRELALVDRELEGVQDLWRKNLVQMQRVTALERDRTRIEGERGQLVAASARAKAKISETELQILQIDEDLRSDVARELREVQAKIAEYVERRTAAEDQLRRVDIRAPQDGIVHQLSVHTVGGVVNNGEPLMLIVPEADKLVVEAKVAPQDIDQLRLGQAAILRFSAFNLRTTPDVNGTIIRIAADATTDQRSGISYYTVRISLPPEEVARLGDVRIMPGMPVEAHVPTGERTVLSYLVKPLYDHFFRAFREK